MNRRVRLLYYSAPEDQASATKFANHLVPLANIVEARSSSEILAGDLIMARLDADVQWADLVVPLISADVVALPRYQELIKACKRHAPVRIVPVLLRAVSGTGELDGLKVLPSNGKAVTSWSNQDEAWVDVVDGIRPLAQSIQPKDNKDPDPEPETLAIYRQRLAPLFDRWETGLVGLVFSGSGMALSAFDQLYVPRRLKEVPDKDHTRTTERGAVIDASALVQRTRHMLIRGAAGAGKSTWIASSFRQLLKHPAAVPFLIKGRELALHWSAKEAKGIARSLDFFLRERVAEHLGDEAAALDVLRVCSISCGVRPILLVDGWDEVGPYGEELRGKLLGFLRHHPRVLAIVTSRPFGLRQPTDGFEQVELQAFDDREIEALSISFFTDQRGGGAEAGREFFSRLRQSPRSLEMARTPLLLTMMLIVRQRHPIPSERHQLYGLCIEELMGNLPEARTLAGAVEPPSLWRPDDIDERIEATQILAHNLQQELFSSQTNIYDEPIYYADADKLASMLPPDWPVERRRSGPPRAALRRGFIEWLAGPAGLLFQDWGGLRFVHTSLQEYLSARALDASLADDAQVGQMFVKAVENVRWWETIQVWSAMLAECRPSALETALDDLLNVSDMGCAATLAGAVFAGGKGSADRFESFLKKFPSTLAFDWSDGTEFCAAAFNARAKDARHHALESALRAHATECSTLPGWLRLDRFANLAGFRTPLPAPWAGKVSAQCHRSMASIENLSGREYGAGRILTGGAPLWPGVPAELAWLQLWPSTRRIVGLRLQLALACGASRGDLEHIAPGVLNAPTWRDVERAHVKMFVDLFVKHYPLVEANRLAVNESRKHIKELRHRSPVDPSDIVSFLARNVPTDDTAEASATAEPHAREWIRDLCRGLALRDACLVPLRIIERSAPRTDSEPDWETNIGIICEMIRKSYPEMVRSMASIKALEGSHVEACEWLLSLTRRRPQRPNGDPLHKLLASMLLEWQRPGLPMLAFNLLREWRLADTEADEWLVEMGWLDAYSIGYYTARAFAAGLDASSLPPHGQMLVHASRLSLNEDMDQALFEDALARYGADGDPLWPALARHLTRRSSNADRILLADLAAHPKLRQGPLSEGLRYLVRGDLVLNDGEHLTLDQLADTVGVDRLPMLDELAPEANVRFDHSEVLSAFG